MSKNLDRTSKQEMYRKNNQKKEKERKKKRAARRHALLDGA
jgi:hypothetical protein